jgi:hypothetical protein
MLSMSSETRSTPLDPITSENAVVLIVDQQEGWFSRIYEPEQTQRHLLALARAAKLLGVPTVLTTNMAAGFNGPQVQALTDISDEAEVLDRTVINAWQDPRVHEAIRRTGRQKVIIAGTGFGLWGTTERKRTIRKMKRLEKRIERQLPRSSKQPHSPKRDDLAPVIKPPVEPIEETDTFLNRSFSFRCSPEA